METREEVAPEQVEVGQQEGEEYDDHAALTGHQPPCLARGLRGILPQLVAERVEFGLLDGVHTFGTVDDELALFHITVGGRD